MMVCRIEAIFNSKPLKLKSSDPDDLDVLTPEHFLIGQPILTISEPNVPNDRMRLATGWILLHQCH